MIATPVTPDTPPAPPGRHLERPRRGRPRNGPAPVFAPDREPWQRQPDESDLAFGLFVIYRDLGPGVRSFDAVIALQSSMAPSPLKKLAVHWGWVDRAERYDADTGARSQAQLAGLRGPTMVRQAHRGEELARRSHEVALRRIDELEAADAARVALAADRGTREALGVVGNAPAVTVNAGTTVNVAVIESRIEEFVEAFRAILAHPDVALTGAQFAAIERLMSGEDDGPDRVISGEVVCT